MRQSYTYTVKKEHAVQTPIMAEEKYVKAAFLEAISS